MKVLEKGHITDTALEEYALNHLDEPELEVLEEHILICPTCQDRLTAVDDFVRAFRMAHGRVGDPRTGREGDAPMGDERPFRGTSIILGDEMFSPMIPVSRVAPAAAWFQRPVVWLGLAVVLGFVALLPLWWDSAEAKQGPPGGKTVGAVSLVAQRGAAGIAEAPAGQLLLNMDLRDLGPGAMVVEVAALNGSVLWSGAVRLSEAGTVVAPGIAFRAGQYWVRVRDSHGGTLLREFGLRVR